MGFIPDRGVSKNKEEVSSPVKEKKPITNRSKSKKNTSTKQQKTKKKIVSYYLETDLINTIKSIADNNDMYYSTLVTSALKNWIANNN